MYSISNKKYINKGKMIDKMELIDMDGFLMMTRKKIFTINNTNIRDIKIVNKNLANPLVIKTVSKKYDKLIMHLTDLLIDDDDEGDNYREALNQIEKFRQEIKNKYRAYLKQKELEKMSRQLVKLQKEAQKKLIEIQNSYQELQTSNNRKR